MADVVVRKALPNEADELTRLCLRSKGYWGYDAAFMAMTEAALLIKEAAIHDGRVLVGIDARGQSVGVAAIEHKARATFELSHLFVDPVAIRTGVGRRLFERAVDLCRERGGRRLTILSDPNAAAFYHHLGARRIGDAPSDAIPGRKLPLLQLDLQPTG